MLPYVTGYRAGYKAAKAADGPGGSGYDAAYRTGMQVGNNFPELIDRWQSYVVLAGRYAGSPEQA